MTYQIQIQFGKNIYSIDRKVKRQQQDTNNKIKNNNNNKRACPSNLAEITTGITKAPIGNADFSDIANGCNKQRERIHVGEEVVSEGRGTGYRTTQRHEHTVQRYRYRGSRLIANA